MSKRLISAAILWGTIIVPTTAFSQDVPMCPTVRSCTVAYGNCVNDRGRTNNQSMQCESYKKVCDQTKIWRGLYTVCRVKL